MRVRVLIGFAVLAAGCGGGADAPVTIERQVAAETVVDPVSQACDDLEALALGSMDDETDLAVIGAELGRIGAIIGATDALPHLAALADVLASGSNATAHPIASAAEVLDPVGYDVCGIPGFTALYVSTSFAGCFERAGIPAGELAPATDGCETGISPDYLPCFDPDQGYVPVDCRTGEGVRLVAREWVAA